MPKTNCQQHRWKIKEIRKAPFSKEEKIIVTYKCLSCSKVIEEEYQAEKLQGRGTVIFSSED